MTQAPHPHRKPIVGICAFTEEVVRDGPERTSVRLVGSRYVDAVERVGGVAVLLPARLDIDAAMADQLVGMLDALILAGGGDVPGRWFGEDDHPEIGPVDEARDEFEIAMVLAALGRGIPMLGVCRGMQVMAVAAGGSVEQHLPDRLGHNDHAAPGVPDGLYKHEVTTVEGSRTRELLGERFAANCHHHQGVGRLGDFVATGWSSDEVLEVMELPGDSLCIGIQSHPETVPDDRLFAALIAGLIPGPIVTETARSQELAG